MLALARRILEPLVVHREALHQVLDEARGGPLAELRAAVAAHAVADGEDGVEVVVLDLAETWRVPSVRTIRNFRIVASAVELALVEDVLTRCSLMVRDVF